MKIINVLKNSKGTKISFELLPPPKGGNIEMIYQVIDPLLEFNPININVTYHQQEVVYKKLSNGLLQKKTIRKRPGTVAIAAAIKYKYPEIEIVPHLICGGFTKSETEYALIDLHFLGIKNILAIRGDPPKNQKYFRAEKDGNAYAIDLVEQIINMNKSRYLDDELENKASTDFSVGVAAYPEKHFESPNLNSDLNFLKEKVEAGADYIITQMFFDNQKFYEFEKKCRDIGIDVPIIPGIKPIVKKSDLRTLPQTFYIDIPEELAGDIRKCKTDKDAYELGIEWAVNQALDLKKHGAPAIHFFTIDISDNIREIAKKVF